MKKGFTLIELLVVVLIIGILSAVAMPQYEKAVWKSRTSQLYTAARSLATAQESYFMANGAYAADFASLDIGFDGLDKKGSSVLGSTASNDSVRGNDNFELFINKTNEFTFSAAGFIKGPYKGAAILFPHETTTSGIKNKTFYCSETGISAFAAGDFCKKVMGLTGTPVTAYSARYYLIN